jgi:malate synthase
MIDEELAKARQSVGDAQFRTSRYNEAAGILRDLIQSPRFVEFLTLPAYEKLNAAERASAGQKS